MPQPELTVLLDIAPETAALRKAVNRDRYERDLALLSRVRASYRRQAASRGWLVVDAGRQKEVVAGDIREGIASRLGLP
jgi:thymidylate kinase